MNITPNNQFSEIFPVPFCMISRQKSHHFCVHPLCQQSSPFICKNCANNQCQQLHAHDDKLQIIKSNALFSLTKNIFGFNTQTFQKRLTSLELNIDNIMVKIRNIYLHCFRRYKSINQFRNEEDAISILQKLKNRDYNSLTGKQLSGFYNQLKSLNKTKMKTNENFVLSEMNQAELILEKLDQILSQNLQTFFLEKSINDSIQNKQKTDNHSYKSYSNSYMQKLKQPQHISLPIINLQRSQFVKDFTYYYKQGVYFFQNQQFSLAKIGFQKALTFDPYHSDTLEYLGLITKKQDNIQKAMQYYDLAIKYNSRNDSVWNNKGLLLYEKQNYQQAFKNFEKAYQIDDTYSKTSNNLGNTCYKLGKYELAIKFYSRALELDKGRNQIAWSNRLLCYKKLQKKKEQQKRKNNSQDQNNQNTFNPPLSNNFNVEQSNCKVNGNQQEKNECKQYIQQRKGLDLENVQRQKEYEDEQLQIHFGEDILQSQIMGQVKVLNESEIKQGKKKNDTKESRPN